MLDTILVGVCILASIFFLSSVGGFIYMFMYYNACMCVMSVYSMFVRMFMHLFMSISSHAHNTSIDHTHERPVEGGQDESV